MANVDCMMCHAPGYERTVLKKEEGRAYFAPAEEIDILAAARSAQRLSREMCNRSHVGAAGGPKHKHGDYPTSPDVDVHIAVGLQCVDCHTTQEHKIARGGHMIAHETPEVQVACTSCRTDTTQSSVGTPNRCCGSSPCA